jgi:hypothetical protein
MNHLKLLFKKMGETDEKSKNKVKNSYEEKYLVIFINIGSKNASRT